MRINNLINLISSDHLNSKLVLEKNTGEIFNHPKKAHTENI